MDWYNGWSPEERCGTLPAQRQAIADGRIAKPTRCSICGFTPADYPGTTNSVWLHDENYADPLAAYHVCRSCHRMLHDRFDRSESWHELVSLHGTGERWFELLTMDQASLRRPFELTYPHGLPKG
jgi:hypothetical protein